MTLAIPSRRRFLLGAGALLAAPAIVRVSALMPVSVLNPVVSVVETEYMPFEVVIQYAIKAGGGVDFSRPPIWVKTVGCTFYPDGSIRRNAIVNAA